MGAARKRRRTGRTVIGGARLAWLTDSPGVETLDIVLTQEMKMTEDARSLRQRMALLVEDVLSGKTSPSDAIDAANMFPVAASHDRLW
jgi:hypothetical protein